MADEWQRNCAKTQSASEPTNRSRCCSTGPRSGGLMAALLWGPVCWMHLSAITYYLAAAALLPWIGVQRLVVIMRVATRDRRHWAREWWASVVRLSAFCAHFLLDEAREVEVSQWRRVGRTVDDDVDRLKWNQLRTWCPTALLEREMEFANRSVPTYCRLSSTRYNIPSDSAEHSISCTISSDRMICGEIGNRKCLSNAVIWTYQLECAHIILTLFSMHICKHINK